MTEHLCLCIDKDGWTGHTQISIILEDEHGDGHGYRIAGPKYNGSSTRIKRHVLTNQDAKEIRAYLDKAFPDVENKENEI